MIIGSTIAPAGSPRGRPRAELIWGFQRFMQAADAFPDTATRPGMPTTFDKREEDFERRFAHDEELRFKSIARRNKLLGLWAAEKLGLSGADADTYARDIVMTEYGEGDRDVFKKIRDDFDKKGVVQSDHQIRRTMEELLEQAVKQVSKTG